MAEGSAIEAKFAELGLDQSPAEFIASLSPHIKRRIEALQELQTKRDEIEVQFRKERAELEAKYDKLYAPLYTERSQVVAGDKEVPAKEGEAAGDESVKGVPEFWTTVLLKCDTTAEMIKDKDLEVLKYLTDVQGENTFKDGAPSGFKLTFHFAENPFFTNRVLEKTYYMLPEDDGVLEKAEGTKIEWNTGKDVTVKLMKKKGKKGGKPQMKTETVESFFNFFSPPDVPGEDDDVDDEAMEELQALIEADYEVGATIKEKLIAKAVKWYTGEAIEDEPYYFGGDDDDDEDFEGEEGEDDDDDDDDAAPKAKGGAKGKKGEQPPECKQQ